MSHPKAKAPHSVPWTEWLIRRFLAKEILHPEEASLSSYIEEAFDLTYEFDGLQSSHPSAKPTTESCDESSDEEPTSELIAKVSSIFGLPSRDLPKSGESWATFFKQLGKNCLGGWDWSPEISFEKKVWQCLVLPIKIFIILPIKILSFPLKLILNFFKVFTEFLPLLLSSLTAHGIGWAIKRLKKHSEVSLRSLGLSAMITLLGLVHTIFNLISLMGRALTSPEKSARMAFDSGRELKITAFGNSNFGIGFAKFLSNVLGGLGALISIGITATLWLLSVPLMISFIASEIPLILQAVNGISQLPAVVAAMSWISQTPLLTASFGAIHGALATLGLALSTAFGPLISTLGAFIGLKLSLGVLSGGSTLGLIAAPLMVILSKIADLLSDAWAGPWQGGGPFTRLSQLLFKDPRSTQKIAEAVVAEVSMQASVKTIEPASTPIQTPKGTDKSEKPTDASHSTPPSATLKDFIDRKKSAGSAAKIAAVSAASAAAQTAASRSTPPPPAVGTPQKRLAGKLDSTRISRWESAPVLGKK